MKKTSTKKSKTVKKPSTKNLKVPRTRNANTLTESEYFGKIRSGLRKTFQYWKPMMIALKNASRPSQNLENKRLKTEYQCNHCKEWFSRKDIQIDHIISAGSLRCLEDIPSFIERLTVEDPNAYQILCKQDHVIKTQMDRVNKNLED